MKAHNFKKGKLYIEWFEKGIVFIQDLYRKLANFLNSQSSNKSNRLNAISKLYAGCFFYPKHLLNNAKEKKK